MARIFQLKVTLKGIQPTIWRRIWVRENIDFSQLHEAIQYAMGWENHHLYEFAIGDYRIGIPDPDFFDGEIEDAQKIRIQSILEVTGMMFTYLYDFGDHWEHVVEFEKILTEDTGVRYPRCIDGAGNCPPEDIGGVGGYYFMLEVLQDPKHPDHEGLLNWLEGGYDPRDFSVDAANLRMRFGPSEDPESLFAQLPFDLPDADLAGLDNRQFQILVRDPFAEDSPIIFQENVSEKLLKQSPLFQLTCALLERLAEQEPIQLTKTKGNLPVRLVKELYELRILPMEDVETGIIKLRIEEEYEPLFTARNVCDMAGIIKKRKGKLSFTQKGRKLWDSGNRGLLFKILFKTFIEKFNWGCFDGFGENSIGQFGAAYTLLLFKQYGDEARRDRFYVQRYFSAFPSLIRLPFHNLWGHPLSIRDMHRAFNARNFYRNLPWWGLVSVKDFGSFADHDFRVKKTPLLNEFIQLRYPVS